MAPPVMDDAERRPVMTSDKIQHHHLARKALSSLPGFRQYPSPIIALVGFVVKGQFTRAHQTLERLSTGPTASKAPEKSGRFGAPAVARNPAVRLDDLKRAVPENRRTRGSIRAYRDASLGQQRCCMGMP